MPESIYHLEPGRYLLSQIYHNLGVAAGSIVPAVGSSIYDDTLAGSSFKEYTVTGHDDDDYAILEEIGGDVVSQDRFVSLADQQLLIYRDPGTVMNPTDPSDLYYKVWIDWKLRVHNARPENYKYVLTTELNSEGEPLTTISRSEPKPLTATPPATDTISFSPSVGLVMAMPPCYIQYSAESIFDNGPVWMILYSANDAEIGRVRLQPTTSQLVSDTIPSGRRTLINIVPQYDGDDITGGSESLTPAQVENAMNPAVGPHFGCVLEYEDDDNNIPVSNILDPPSLHDSGWLKMYGPDIPDTPVSANYPVVIKYFLPPHQWGVYSGESGTNPGSTRFLTATFNVDLDASGT